MNLFFHEKQPNDLSQIELLANAAPPYNLLYEKLTTTATRKNDNINTILWYELKNYVTFDSSKSYVSGEDIL